MSEQNSIYNLEGKTIGRFKYGVAWSHPERKRLGEYTSEFVYDNNKTLIAKILDGRVLGITGTEIGFISGKKIFVQGLEVGSFTGFPEAGASAIPLLFDTTNIPD